MIASCKQLQSTQCPISQEVKAIRKWNLVSQLWFFRQRSGTSFSTRFYVWFFKKSAFYIIWYWLTWLLLVPEILGNMCIVIIGLPVCGVINFKINFNCLIKTFSYMAKNAEQRFKYLQSGKSFLDEIKKIVHHFKGLSVVRNYLTNYLLLHFYVIPQPIRHVWSFMCNISIFEALLKTFNSFPTKKFQNIVTRL